jgi:hypothetical protein
LLDTTLQFCIVHTFQNIPAFHHKIFLTLLIILQFINNLIFLKIQIPVFLSSIHPPQCWYEASQINSCPWSGILYLEKLANKINLQHSGTSYDKNLSNRPILNIAVVVF